MKIPASLRGFRQMFISRQRMGKEKWCNPAVYLIKRWTVDADAGVVFGV